MPFIVRPPTPRRSPNDVLRVSWHFTARHGVEVSVKPSVDDDSVMFTVVFDGNSYDAPDLPPPLAQKDLRIFIKDFPPENRDQLNQYIYGQVGKLIQDVLPFNANHLRDVVEKGGAWMDVYGQPMPASVLDSKDVFDLDIRELGFGTVGVSFDSNQVFPIYGWINLRWERQ